MQNKKLILLIVLSITAIASLIYGIVTPSSLKRQLSSESVTEIAKAEKLVVKKGIIPNRRLAKRSKFVDWGRNPFVSKKFTRKTTPAPVLNGIVWDKNNPQAIINGKIVNVGDKIEGRRVVDIRPNKVVLNNGIKEYELRLEQ